MYWCGRCDRSFVSERALTQHENTSSRHHICYQCCLDFSNREGLVQHWVQSRDHFYCQKCNDHFDYQHGLEAHYEGAHYYCKPCKKIFNFARGLEQHNLQSHPNHHKWVCEPCNKVFNTEGNLKNHLQSSAHLPRTFRCPGRNCQGTFIDEADFILHCESGRCPSGVTRAEVNRVIVLMDRHSVITNPARLIGGPEGTTTQYSANEFAWNGQAYECFLCPKEFRSLKALNAHLNSSVHEQKLYKCPVAWDGCHKEFKTLGGLLQHMKSASCNVKSYKRNMVDMIGSLSNSMRLIGI